VPNRTQARSKFFNYERAATNSGTFPTNIVIRKMDNANPPANSVTRPAYIASRATTIVSLPTTVECSVLATVTFPANAGGRPMDSTTLPAGIDCLVLTTENLPNGLKTPFSHFF